MKKIYEEDSKFMSKDGSHIPLEEVLPDKDFSVIINQIESELFESTHHLLNTCQYIFDKKSLRLRISTIESITAGLIMSSLTNVAFGTVSICRNGRWKNGR